MEKIYIESIYNNLKLLFPEPKCELIFHDAYSLLVAVILSAQCTDKRVNQVMPSFLLKYPTVYDLANADADNVGDIIKSCGFYNSKSKNLIECAKKIVNNFNGVVPSNLEDLITLNGVGRKTANVILSNIYNVPAIAVDTHVFRVSNRLGLSQSSNVMDCELQLMEVIDKKYWTEMHYLLVLFGRYYCKAIKPLCDGCKFINICKEKKCKR